MGNFFLIEKNMKEEMRERGKRRNKEKDVPLTFLYYK